MCISRPERLEVEGTFGGERSAAPMGGAQQGKGASAQLAAWYGVECRVDGFVREAYRLGHRLQCGGYLLGTQPLAQQAHNAVNRADPETSLCATRAGQPNPRRVAGR